MTAPDADVVFEALQKAGWDAKVRRDDLVVIVDCAPESDDYGGSTEPGSEWDEECDRREKAIRDALPAGWTPEWSDDDLHIVRVQS